MSKISDVIDHINNLELEVIRKITAYMTGSGLGHAPLSSFSLQEVKEWYQEQFEDWRKAVRSYSGNSAITPGSSILRWRMSNNKSIMESDMYEIITAGINYFCINLNPSGYSEISPVNMWDYFGANGEFDNILTKTVDDVYIGIAGYGYSPIPTIQLSINNISQAPAVEHNDRMQFRDLLMGDYMQYNLPEMLEPDNPDCQALGPDEDPPRIEDIGRVLYIDWKIKEIIEAFDLNIYIPTYVRS